MRLPAAVLPCLLILTLSSTASAITWNVPIDAPTIQAGIDSASTGDTVLVACDIYYEYDIAPKSGITVRSEAGDPSCAIVDAGGLGVVFNCGGVDSTTTIEGFTITGGSGSNGGGVILSGCHLSFVDCVLSGNSAAKGGGIYCFGSSPRITRCILSRNEATDSGGGMYLYFHCYPILTNCTFFENAAPTAGGLYCQPLADALLNNTIIAFSTLGEAVACEDQASTLLTCCDVYGNAGGDWVGCIAGQDSVNNNLWADPMFCDPDAGNFTLAENSPCAPDHSPLGCGLIGADTVGCSATAVAGAEIELPTALYLGPAVPNPFNPITEISYGIPAGGVASRVIMKVYDATGREVTTLIDQDQGPGEYRVVWDGRDHKGVGAASGVYFYRVTWNGRSETRRMVLLK